MKNHDPNRSDLPLIGQDLWRVRRQAGLGRSALRDRGSAVAAGGRRQSAVISMTTVTVSSAYQITIPQSIVERHGIRPGQKIQEIPYEGRIELILLRPMRDMRGFVRGIDTRVDRESDHPIDE